MLHKMNYTASSSDTVQQNKIWANMAVSQKAAKKNLKIQRMVQGNYNVQTAECQFKAMINRVCE